MRKRQIVVVGSANTDMIARVPRLPRPGETVLGRGFLSVSGGKGANQAVAAARAGGALTFVARVGNDLFGARALKGYKRDRIHTRYVVRDKHNPSGVALIFVAENGQNSIAVAPGANSHLSPADVDRAEPAISTADLLLIQLETPLRTVATALRLAVKHKVPVILNPAPAQSLADSVLKRVSILTPNQIEAEFLTGVKVTNDRAAARAAEKLRLRGARTVVITMGTRGAFVADASGGTRVPGFRVKAVDTTAAGDAFNGALAVALSEGCMIVPAVRFAHAAAALSVTRLGAQPSAPTREEIDRFLKARNNQATIMRPPQHA